MSKQAFVKIGDTTYVINAFKGAKGLKFIPKISKLIIPFFVGMSGSVAEGEDELTEAQQALASLNEEKSAKMFMELLSGDNADELVDLIQDLLTGVTKGGVAIDFDEEFSQEYDKMIKLVVEVIKLNYQKSFQNLATVFK